MGAFSRGTRTVARWERTRGRRPLSSRASERADERAEPVSKARKNRRRYEGGEGREERRREKWCARGYSPSPRSWMKTVRGIFLTTRGHPGTAVSKDCASQMKGKEGGRVSLSVRPSSFIASLFSTTTTTTTAYLDVSLLSNVVGSSVNPSGQFSKLAQRQARLFLFRISWSSRRDFNFDRAFFRRSFLSCTLHLRGEVPRETI